jgi:1,2-diacylglycerol 3-alpha-glucosyltransferase
MAIGIFTDSYKPKIDGISVSVSRYVDELRRRKVNFRLFAPKIPGALKDEDDVIRFTSMPMFFDREIRVALPIGWNNLKDAFSIDFELVHSHTPVPGPLGFVAIQVARRRKIPYFYTFHTYLRDYGHYILDGRIISKNALDQLSSWWANQADYVIVPSAKIEHWLKKIGVKREIKVIPNGVETQLFQEGRNQTDYLVDKGFISREDFVLLYVGRLAKEKSVDKLIRHFYDSLNNINENVKLVLVGDGVERLNLMKMVKDLKIESRVIFTGYIAPDKMHEVYRSADIFCFLSTSETQGMVVIEAIASGLPILLAKDAAYDGVIEEGENGFYVNSTSDFVTNFNEIYSNAELRQRFSERSVQISNQFDISYTTTQVLDYYANSLKEYRKLNPEILMRKRIADSLDSVQKSFVIWQKNIIKDLFNKDV